VAQGFLAFVLHAHLPFVRHPEHEFFLEEDWLYEAITETYLPLLEVFEGLVRDGVPFYVSMSFSPTLVAMLRDDLLRFRAERHLLRLSELVDKEIDRTRDDGHLHYLAGHYRERLDSALGLWRRWGGDLVAAFSALEARGVLEILTCGATHAYLPLWQHQPAAVRTQIFCAVEEHERQFGREPRGIWLPECGYFPGLDRVLADAGLKYFLVDAHGIHYATPRPRYHNHAPLYCPDSGVAAFGRDEESSVQVWSKDQGYPGDFTYREFYRDIGWDLPLDYVRPYVQPTGARKNTGIKYHRITRKGEPKDLYDPYWARQKAIEHAGNFVFNRERQVEHLAGTMGRPPIVVAPYDAELFGHWWYEGPIWLDEVIRKMARDSNVVALTHPGEYLTRMPTQQVATPAESSWGDKGYHEFWLSDENAWIYPHLHHAAERMREIARTYAGREVGPEIDRALRQAMRELLLAQGSDWAFILRSGTMPEYASRRTVSHVRRFLYLADQLREGRVDEEWLRRLEAVDNLFPGANWRHYLGG
jgi:1,4-alpha-glucan branching enzyme